MEVPLAPSSPITRRLRDPWVLGTWLESVVSFVRVEEEEGEDSFDDHGLDIFS
jgi:hypothetical protein